MIKGKNSIGFESSAEGNNLFSAMNPAKSTELEGKFHSATPNEVKRSVNKATEAFKVYGRISGAGKATFLEQIAEEIVELGDALIQRAMLETGLPEARLIGERGRTTGQLKMFAELVREGSWVEASIDTAIPNRTPIPKPDLRKLMVPIGPVVVFGASNFPFAYSTAGGDTASALAAGNPVIVKAHNSHPGTSEMVAGAILAAAQKTKMPDGVFSHLHDQGYDVGQQLVGSAGIKAVGFTGSFNGGKALYDLAGKREDPIPVFAEMGSINPVIILPGAFDNIKSLARKYAGSITLGSGQFCTNPGLLVSLKSPELEKFKETLDIEIREVIPSVMLNEGIYRNYESRKDATVTQDGVVLSHSQKPPESNCGVPLIASVSGKEFLNNALLHEEVFGPFSLIVECYNEDQLSDVAASLKGQLTITILGSEEELRSNSELIHQLSSKSGRLIFNGVPTGVEVCASMQHGGPFPASTDSRFTSVGAGAIKRFVRPLSYQDWPNDLLPEELQDSNPLDIWRNYNNQWIKTKN